MWSGRTSDYYTEILSLRSWGAAKQSSTAIALFDLNVNVTMQVRNGADVMEDFADEQGCLIQVSENSNWDNFQRMFPYEAAGSGRALRVQAVPGANPSAEVRLKNAADEGKYNGVVCGTPGPRRSDCVSPCSDSPTESRLDDLSTSCDRLCKISNIKCPLLLFGTRRSRAAS